MGGQGMGGHPAAPGCTAGSAPVALPCSLPCTPALPLPHPPTQRTRVQAGGDLGAQARHGARLARQVAARRLDRLCSLEHVLLGRGGGWGWGG